ncbi:hypothetical protein HNP84_006515 [Thermocatellispora tengchongensis]|uniref:Tetratricopeptide repeat protein n=1 Tax=Thermocatellispora tengchongensis TaxID=1073253 RepID=A0A840P608_9ACTN|nr:hypothetical protein [Thermocatellispora tengchongensis]MBB5136764.1 hypothetical protein [Thermocatellispora tengchongensis]
MGREEIDYEQALRESIVAFLTSVGIWDSYDVLEKHPILFTDEARRLGRHIADDVREDVDPLVAAHIDAQLELLRDAQSLGMTKAFSKRFTASLDKRVAAAEDALQRFLGGGHLDTLDEAIALWREVVTAWDDRIREFQALGATELADHFTAYSFHLLCRAALALRYGFVRHRGGVGLLDEAIGHLERARRIPSDDADRVAECWMEMGRVFVLRHRLNGDPADRDRAADAYQSVMRRTRPGSLKRREALAGLQGVSPA